MLEPAEFLGTLVVDSGTRSKIVHYWRMEASGEATRPLMDDIRAVDWLPLDEAVERLSRSHEKAFLENVGPYALAGLIRRTKAKPVEEEKAAVSKPAAKSTAATRPAASKVAAAKPSPTRKRRMPAVEPAGPAMAPGATSEPVEVTPVESAPAVAKPAGVPVGDATAIAAETTMPVPEAEALVDAGEPAEVIAETSVPTVAEADMATHEAPVTPAAADVETNAPAVAAAEPTKTEISDVERVQAIAVEIKSISEAAAREIAAAAARADESDTKFESLAPGADKAGSEFSLPEPVILDAQDSAGESAEETEPQRRTLAQKVRGWFGHAA